MSAQCIADIGIEVPPHRSGEIDTTCPRCSQTRKKHTDRCLSVNTIDGTWCCHHCGWVGCLSMNCAGYGSRFQRDSPPPPPRVFTTPTPPPDVPLSAEAVQYFANRGIPEPILLAAGITVGSEWCPQLASSILAIRFPYLRDGRLVNIKYRALREKLFWMVKGAQRILYGLDDLVGVKTACIVEGELDKLSLATVGGPPTVSVPDGAPAPNATHYASKFAFLDATAIMRLHAATTVLIGTDMDGPGERLGQELARRIGYERCVRVSWAPYKDANELLVAEGSEAVLAAVAATEPCPMPLDSQIPHGNRPISLLPCVQGRRPAAVLTPEEDFGAR